MEYLPRVADSELARQLSGAGAVVVEGPRACGKTSTARQVAASEALLDTDENARRLVDADPAAALAGAVPRLFDEWQVAPAIWNQVRRAVDERGKRGQFILTGSAVPADEITRHTGAGRFSRLRMRPLSLFEAGRSSGKVSLAALLAGERPRAPAVALSVSEAAEIVCVGGWPGNLGSGTKAVRAGSHGAPHRCRSRRGPPRIPGRPGAEGRRGRHRRYRRSGVARRPPRTPDSGERAAGAA